MTSEEPPRLPNRAVPFSDAFKAFIAQGWAPYPTALPEPLPATASTAARREALGAQFPGERLVIAAGGLEVRSNDTDYRFRPHSAFAHLTGLGTDREPDAVLVLEPTDPHERQQPRRDALLQAARPARLLGVLRRRPLRRDVGGRTALARRDGRADRAADRAGRRAGRAPAQGRRHDPRPGQPGDLTPELRARARRGRPAQRPRTDSTADRDAELMTALSELRLVKDAFEADQMREACTLTATGFEAVVADLPRAVAEGRGERWVEGVFGLHARHLGNAVGYDTIAAAGDHACTLHWIRNDGDLRLGDLLLLDAGVELDSLYTADVTRTLPVSGTFTEPQRRVYEAVLAAQEAGIAAAQPGATFADVHRASIRVIAEHLDAWGLLPVPLEEALSEEGGQHRRWMPHGTSHHLGIDVHDCADARRENYREGVLAPGMVITVEPGLYFKADDQLVAGRAARHRRPDRGRRPDHRGRQREPLRPAPPHRRRRRGLDGRRLGAGGRRDDEVG